MIPFVVSLVLLAFAAVAIALGASVQHDGQGAGRAFVIGGGAAVLALILALFACIYSQDAGEVSVLRNLGGSIAGSNGDAGFHGKAPWQSAIRYDVRNNVISYVKSGNENYTGGSANGPQVTVNDRSGASADVDIQINYSLDPRYAINLYREYGKQETFVRSVAAVDARSIPREVAGQFTTIDMLTNRGKFTNAVQKALTAKWRDIGLHVEQVSVQEIRYPKTITDGYAAAQASVIDQQKAQNEQQVARTEAETKRIQAQGEANANSVLNQSLTDQVLRQHYIDALSNAKQLIVTPDGSSMLISPGK